VIKKRLRIEKVILSDVLTDEARGLVTLMLTEFMDDPSLRRSTMILTPQMCEQLGISVSATLPGTDVLLTFEEGPHSLEHAPAKTWVRPVEFGHRHMVGETQGRHSEIEFVSPDKDGHCWAAWRKIKRPVPFFHLFILLTRGPFEDAERAYLRHYSLSIERVTDQTDLRNAA